MKIIIEPVFGVQFSEYVFRAFGDVYLNGNLKAWIGFFNKVELKAEPGENTIRISYKQDKGPDKEIKFYATEDVHIFVKVDKVKSSFSVDLMVDILAVGDDLKIIEESGTIK